MKRLALSTAILLSSTGCLEVEKVSYTFDLSSMSAEVLYVGIRSDSADNVEEDFKQLMGEFVNGNKLETENLGWNIQSKELFEEDGKLMGKVKFNFRALDNVKIYQHDKKSPYIFCDNEQTVLSSNGTGIQDVLKGCVAWDSKQTSLEVSLGKAGGFAGEPVSLLEKWQGSQG